MLYFTHNRPYVQIFVSRFGRKPEFEAAWHGAFPFSGPAIPVSSIIGKETPIHEKTDHAAPGPDALAGRARAAGGGRRKVDRGVDDFQPLGVDPQGVYDAAADFAAATGVKVNYVRIATNDFTRSWSPTSPQDVPRHGHLEHTPGIEFYNTGIVAPVDDPGRRGGRDKYTESVLKMFTIDGALYEIPILMRPPACTCARAGGEGRLRHHAQDRRQRQYYYEGLRTWETCWSWARS